MTRYQLLRFIHSKLANFMPAKFIAFLALFVIIPLITAASGYTAQITLEWDQNDELNLAGYKLYVGYSSRDYQF
jgi:hypothetical protein